MQTKFLRKRGDPTDNVKRQIISLGCGYDTFVFSLMSARDKWCPFSYYELDLPEVVAKKVDYCKVQAKFIEKCPQLREALKSPELVQKSADLLVSEHYGLASCDLTNLSGLEKTLKSLGVDFK